MLARTYRLRKNSDFQRLYKTGKRFVSANLVLYYAPSKLTYSQFGFVVSKKVSKKAVVRNSLRRRASAVLQDYFGSIKSPIKAIVLIRKDFSAIKHDALDAEIKQLLSKVIE